MRGYELRVKDLINVGGGGEGMEYKSVGVFLPQEEV